jgi:hypothetical protein
MVPEIRKAQVVTDPGQAVARQSWPTPATKSDGARVADVSDRNRALMALSTDDGEVEAGVMRHGDASGQEVHEFLPHDIESWRGRRVCRTDPMKMCVERVVVISRRPNEPRRSSRDLSRCTSTAASEHALARDAVAISKSIATQLDEVGGGVPRAIRNGIIATQFCV